MRFKYFIDTVFQRYELQRAIMSCIQQKEYEFDFNGVKYRVDQKHAARFSSPYWIICTSRFILFKPLVDFLTELFGGNWELALFITVVLIESLYTMYICKTSYRFLKDHCERQ